MLQRAIDLPVLLVMDLGMAVTEGSSFDVLSTEADMVAFHQKSPESQCFTGCPIHSFSLLNHLSPLLVYSLDGFMWSERGRKHGDSFSHFFQHRGFHTVDDDSSFTQEFQGMRIA